MRTPKWGWPREAGKLAKLAAVHAQRGDRDRAVALYLRARNAYRSAGLVAELHQVGQRLLALAPARVEVRVEVARDYLDQGREDDALQLLKPVAKARLDKGHALEVLELLRPCFAAARNDAAALELVARAFTLTGSKPRALVAYATCAEEHMLQGREAEARRIYQIVLGLDPRNAAAARALEALGPGPAGEDTDIHLGHREDSWASTAEDLKVRPRIKNVRARHGQLRHPSLASVLRSPVRLPVGSR